MIGRYVTRTPVITRAVVSKGVSKMSDVKKPLSDALRFAALASATSEKLEQREREARAQRAAEKPIAPYLVAAMR